MSGMSDLTLIAHIVGGEEAVQDNKDNKRQTGTLLFILSYR